jgi:signal transduction histidine kinase
MGDALRSANNKLNLLNNIIRHDTLNTVAGLLGLEDMALDITRDAEATELLTMIKGATLKFQQQITFTREYQNIGIHSPQWQEVTEVVERVGAQVDHRDITLAIEVKDTEIYADPLLEKVFYNLLDNALRYGETLTAIRFHTQELPDSLILICEDDGVGVPAHLKKRIFEQGYGKNTGQGLFLVREILAITGISITETGTQGRGARFEMIIPRNGSRMVMANNQTATEPAGTGSDHAVIMR